MSILREMQAEADINFAQIGDLPEYPTAERVDALRADPGYFGRVLLGYGVTLHDPDPDYRRVAKGRHLPDDVMLMGLVESTVIEGNENDVHSHPAASRKMAANETEFNVLADEATNWVHYGGGPGARLLVPEAKGRWRLYERSQSFVVPELDDDNRPTGQFVGVPSYNVPSQRLKSPRLDLDEVDLSGEGLGKFVDGPDVDVDVSSQEGVQVWTENIVVPRLVAAEVAHIQLAPGLLKTRKVELAWYYRPNDEPAKIFRQRTQA